MGYMEVSPSWKPTLIGFQGVHAGLAKSYICFSVCKALQSLIFRPKCLIKSYFLLKKKFQIIKKMRFPP